MSLSQSTTCGICKQNFEKTSLENNIIRCTECEAPYHKDHLKIWLQIDDDCPVCRQDLQKLAFVTYSIKYEQLSVSGELYLQLNKIFPRGIPMPIFEKYIQEYPKGIPQDKFTAIKEKHSSNRISDNEQRRINVKKREAIAYKNRKNDVLIFIGEIFFFIVILMVISVITQW